MIGDERLSIFIRFTNENLIRINTPVLVLLSFALQDTRTENGWLGCSVDSRSILGSASKVIHSTKSFFSAVFIRVRLLFLMRTVHSPFVWSGSHLTNSKRIVPGFSPGFGEELSCSSNFLIVSWLILGFTIPPGIFKSYKATVVLLSKLFFHPSSFTKSRTAVSGFFENSWQPVPWYLPKFHQSHTHRKIHRTSLFPLPEFPKDTSCRC